MEEYSEISPKSILLSLIIKKKIFGSLALSTLFLAAVYLFLKKPIYEGQIQIVLSPDQDQTLRKML